VSILVFKLNGVPDDEAEDVRRLLSTNHIEYYETAAGKWGISTAAIWVYDNTQAQIARRLIAEYEKDRSHRLREEYEELRREGKSETFIARLIRHPVEVLGALAIILIVLYFSIKPFVGLGQ
jgi:hypothetical protein